MATDAFSEYYAELLDGAYDVVDRIVLNGYFQLAQSAGGFRTWWRQLYDGDDGNLDNTHLMRMAGRFSRRLRGWADKPPTTSRNSEGRDSFAVQNDGRTIWPRQLA